MAENRLLSHIRIYIPMVNEYPLEKAENWAKKYEQGLSHTLAQQRKAIPTQKAFFEKVARPILDKFQYLTDPEFNGVVSRKGRTGEDIYARMKDRLLDHKTARKYFRNTKMAYQTRDGVDAKRIKDWLPYAAAYYAMEMTFGAWRFLGPIQHRGRGAFAHQRPADRGDEHPGVCAGYPEYRVGTGRASASYFRRGPDDRRGIKPGGELK